jgi:hypothetical protein
MANPFLLVENTCHSESPIPYSWAPANVRDASEHISFKIVSHRHVALCQAIDDLTELFRVLRCEFDTNVRELNPLSPILA